MAQIGIDFGTTNSLIVAYNKLKNEFLYFNFGPRGPVPTSSTVWYHDGKIVVGDVARTNIHNFSGVEGHHFEKSIKLRLGTEQNINILGESVQPYKVAAEILRHIKNDAIDVWKADKAGVSLNRAVFTVPIKFTGKQRRDLRQAANEAGIEVVTFIHEPFAAVIGFYFSQARESNSDLIIDELKNLEGKTLLTFDWGGGTLDITVVKVENGKMMEIGTSELTNFAGDKFDENIAYWAWNRFLQNYRGKYSSDYLEKIRKSHWDRMLAIAENCKISLSSETSTTFLLESIIPGKNDEGIDETITRNDFEKLISNTLEKAINKIDDATRTAGINDNNISQVILTGGSCYIPVVQNAMKNKFGHRVEFVNNAELLIAQGAAVISELGWLPFLTKDISIELSDGSFWPMFESGMPIAPSQTAHRREIFSCVDQREKLAKVIVCEGMEQQKDRNLAVLNVPILNNNQFGDDIIIEGDIDNNIILTVKAHSVFVQGYKTKDRSGIDEEYSIRKIAEVFQMCFGLDFGDM